MTFNHLQKKKKKNSRPTDPDLFALEAGNRHIFFFGLTFVVQRQ